MISFQQIRKFFLTMILTIMLAITIAFDFGTASNWAATPLKQQISQSQPHIATMNPAEAFTKNVKGTVQEGMDNSIENSNYKPGVL